MAPAGVARVALTRSPADGTTGCRGRPARPTHAAYIGVSGAAFASRRRARLAAFAADSGPVRAAGGLYSVPDRHTAAALRQHYGLRRSGKRGGVSRGRRGRESRAARRHQQRHQPHNSRARGHTHAHTSLFARVAHLGRAAAAIEREAGGQTDPPAFQHAITQADAAATAAEATRAHT